MKQIYDQHHVGRPFVEKNYKAALIRLEREGRIVAVPPASKRPLQKGQPTFADTVRVTFPGGG